MRTSLWRSCLYRRLITTILVTRLLLVLGHLLNLPSLAPYHFVFVLLIVLRTLREDEM